MALSPAKRRGITPNVELKMTGNKSIGVLGSQYSDMKDYVWVMVSDDNTDSPNFKTVCGKYSSRALYVTDFTPVKDLDALANEPEENDNYTKSQRHAVKTFTTMLERAKLYRENGSTDDFDPSSGICDNIGACRPAGADFDLMYRVKDNVIRVVPSYSGAYHYPVKHPNPRDGHDAGDEAERAWDNTSNKWAGSYGAMRLIQLEELLDHVKNKWNENLTTVLTPAQQRGIIINETVCQNIHNGTLWILQKDDDTANPYFIPFGNTGTDGRTDIHLKNIRVLSCLDAKKRSVRGFVSNANRIEKQREKLERLKAKVQAQLDALKGELAMNDYQLGQQHGVKRIDNNK